VSVVVIDYKKNNPYLIECLDALQKQTYKHFEIILETDHPKKIKYPHLKIIDYQGKYIPPANKRDHGAEVAKGDIIAFIDDDAYPNPNWLASIVRHFSKKDIVAVGGPGVTPPGVSWQEEASGWASASPFGSGFYYYRFLAGAKKYVDDFPSMNLSIRRTDFLSVGGFDSNYWPGEDTKLCLDLVNKTGKRIIYDPKTIVYHHRRLLWRGHLRQNGNFGLHRGFFAKVLPQTSLRPLYMLPSLMDIGLVLLLLSFFVNSSLFSLIRQTGLFFLCLYILSLVVNSVWISKRSQSIFQGLVSIPAIFLTHSWYGLKFMEGFFFTAKLKR